MSTVLTYEDLMAMTVEELQAYAVENLISAASLFDQFNLGPGDPTPPAEAQIFLDAVEQAFGIDTSNVSLNGDEALVTDDAFAAFLDEFVLAIQNTGFDLDGFLSGGFEPDGVGFINPGPDVAPLETFATIDAISIIDTLLNFGLTFIPPDPIAAAGTDRLVNVVNTAVEIFDKQGTLLDQFPLDALFDSPTDTFDPKVIYDHFNDRFLIVTLEQQGVQDAAPNPENDSSVIYVAVSQDGSPTTQEDWDIIAIDGLTSGLTTAGTPSLLWADYPGFAVSEDAVYITANRFVVDGPGAGTPGLWVIEKGEDEGGFYDGGAPNVVFSEPVIDSGLPPSLGATLQPSLNFSTPPAGVDNFLYSAGFSFGLGVPGAPEAAIVYEVSDPFGEGGPIITANIVVLPDFDLVAGVLPDAPQGDSGAPGLEVNDRRSLDSVFRDGLLYTTFTGEAASGPNAGQTTAYYSVLDPANGFALVELNEIGGEDIAPGTFTFFPSIAVNAQGDVIVAFSAAGPELLGGSYAVGRQAGDAPGFFSQSIVISEGEAAYSLIDGSGRNRWGDYTGAVVDPVDDTFWVYNQNAAVFPGFIPVWDTAYGNIQFSEDNNNLFGDSEDDILIGGDGNDSLFGRGGNDTIDGGDGNEQIFGDQGDDFLIGGAGTDQIFGGQGSDVIFGGDDDDRLFGDGGDDFIFGDDGDDSIFAGGGNDVIAGGAGDDEAFGGGGNNVFVYEEGFDSFRDFNFRNDTVDVVGTGITSLEELIDLATSIGGQLAFVFDEVAGDIAQVFNTRIDDLTEDNFIFAPDDGF